MRRLFCVCLALAACHPAASPSTGQSRIDEVAWLEGDWGGQEREVWTEEHWTGARGATMLASHRSVRDEHTINIAFLRLEATAADVTLWTSLGDNASTAYTLTKVDGQRATFRNTGGPGADWIIYERTGNTLEVRLEADQAGTAPKRWTWHRL